MLQYPSIDGSKKAPLGKHCFAYYKYDGSNLRWEWSPKKGWTKFGTRRLLFDTTTPFYNQAIPIFMDTIAEDLLYRAKQLDKKTQRIIAFTEFYGPSSFAGNHVEGEPMKLTLIDFALYKKGIIGPKQFNQVIKGAAYAPEIVYEGELSLEFIKDVRAGKYPVVEGVICKGDDFMVKVKTTEYLIKLYERFNDSWINYGE